MGLECAGIQRQSGLLDLDVADDRALDPDGKVGPGTDLAEVRLPIEFGLLADQVTDRRDQVLDRHAQRFLGLTDPCELALRLDAEGLDELRNGGIEHGSILAHGGDKRAPSSGLSVGRRNLVASPTRMGFTKLGERNVESEPVLLDQPV